MFKILLVAIVTVGFVQASVRSVKAFNDAKIPKDLGITVPSKEMKVDYFVGNVKAAFGNNLKLNAVKVRPFIDWDADASTYFTIVAIDLDDADSRKGTGYILWLINNYSDNNTLAKEILAYEAPKTAGHRIAFFVFTQNGINSSTVSTTIRKNFDLASYVKNSGLTGWAGNFFITA